MAQYIDKDAVVAEIERQQRKLCLLGQSHEVELRKSAAIQNGAYCSLLSFLNTLKVKEVDLGREISFQWSKFCLNGKDKNFFVKIAEHFFELGLKVVQKRE